MCKAFIQQWDSEFIIQQQLLRNNQGLVSKNSVVHEERLHQAKTKASAKATSLSDGYLRIQRAIYIAAMITTFT